MKKLVGSLALGVILAVSLFSYARAQVTIDKRTIRSEIKPGEEKTIVVNVENPSSKDVIVKAYFEDFEYAPPYDGTKEFFPLGSTARSCGKWITVTPGQLIVAPKGKQMVSCRIRVPNEAKGGYYGILFFEEGSPMPAGDHVMGVILRTGCTFLLETADTIKDAEVGEITVTKDNMQGFLSNSGDAVLVSRISSHIMNDKGVMFKRSEVKTYYIPPGKKSAFSVKLPQDLPVGMYTLLFNCDIGGKKPLVKEIDFAKSETGEIAILQAKD